MPRVSVVVPVRRPRLDWLREAIDSVLAQTFVDFELLIVVDDVESLGDFMQGFGDKRIRHFHLESAPGLPVALNFGVAQARAPLVARFDADDLCEPRRLESQVAMFDTDPSLDVAGSQVIIIDAHGVPIGSRQFPTQHAGIVRALQRYNSLAHPSVMFRRQRILDAGGYPLRPMEDYDLWCALAVAGARFANHPETLIRYRYHAGLTRSRVGRTLRATMDIKRRHFGPALTFGSRFRIALEWLLLWVPGPIVNTLFRMTQFRPVPRHGSPSPAPDA